MEGKGTFSMKEARNRYLIATVLFALCALLSSVFPFAVVLLGAVQGLVFRLSKPSALAFLPICIATVLLMFIYRSPFVLLLMVSALALGIVLRFCQKKHLSKNVAVSAMTAILLVCLIAAFALFLYRADALHAEGIRQFFVEVKEQILQIVIETFESGSGTVEAESLDEFISLTTKTLEQSVLILPAYLSIFFFVLSCASIALYRVFCLLFRMKDGLPIYEWRLTVSVPVAAFYAFLVVLSFFWMDTDTVLGLSFVNLKLLLGFFIAVIGIGNLCASLSSAFPRISKRTFTILAVLLLCFSAYGALMMQGVAIVTAVGIILSAFRNRQ